MEYPSDYRGTGSCRHKTYKRLVVGNAVTDIPRNLLDFLSLAQPIEAGNEIFGVLGGGSVEFSVLYLAEILVGGI